MKLFTCQKHFIQELWQQLPWLFLEPRTGWVCPCSSTWMLQELLLLGFSYWLRASGKWVQILPFCAFAITSSLKRAFVRLSKYILSSARCWCQGYEVRHESAWVFPTLPLRPRPVAALGRLERGTNNDAEHDWGCFSPLSLPVLRTENTCDFLSASPSTFRTRSPCFPPQAEYRALGSWLPQQGGEDIHIFPTPFFSLVDISRCASSRLAKHKQAFRATGSWTRGPAGARVPSSPRHAHRGPARAGQPRNLPLPSSPGFLLIDFYFFFFFASFFSSLLPAKRCL